MDAGFSRSRVLDLLEARPVEHATGMAENAYLKTSVVSSVRGVVYRFPTSMPWNAVWRIVAKCRGAIPA